MMDKQMKKFNKEIQKLLNKIKKKQLEQSKYLENKQLFNEISKLQYINVLQCSNVLKEYTLLQNNIFVYFVNHRKIINVLFSELKYNRKFNEYVLEGRGICGNHSCEYNFKFNDKNKCIKEDIYGNFDNYRCSEWCRDNNYRDRRC